METLASIDFSINSAFVCIKKNDAYIWHHFGREKTSYFDLSCNGYTSHFLPKRTKGEDYCQTERLKLVDSEALCESIVSVLFSESVTKVALEGHSFNSKGNSLLELVSYQFLLRNMIKSSLSIQPGSMFFYPPITIKSFAGGAKFKKKDMLDKFIESDDQILKESEVYKKIFHSLDSIIKKDEVVKPVDDLVDSYWILKKLEKDV